MKIAKHVVALEIVEYILCLIWSCLSWYECRKVMQEMMDENKELLAMLVVGQMSLAFLSMSLLLAILCCFQWKSYRWIEDCMMSC